jgi:hypothetical protein
MKNEIIRIEIDAAPEARRWQQYFVWAAIFITGVVVGATFF